MTSSTATNMYRVGDYVYFEINSSSPFQIRRIEELNKTQAGNVEAKVMCFYRRRDIAPALLKIIDDRPATGPSVAPVPAAAAAAASDDVPAVAAVPEIVPPGSDETKPTDEPHIDLPEEEKKPSDDVVMKEEENIEAAAVPNKEESSAQIPADVEMNEAPESKPDAELEVVKSEPTAILSEPAPTEEPTKSAEPEPTTNPADPETKTETEVKPTSDGPTAPPVSAPKTAIRMPGEDDLSDLEKHRLLHRELFLSRQIETLPATHIRGKCSVTLLNEIETPDSYLGRDDMFFYSLVYDPAQKTLIADKGEIRIGDKYQADIPEQLKDEEKDNWRKDGLQLETLIYQPLHNLTDRQIDQFVIVARAVGTFARALDMSSSAKQPNLHLTAAAASRDVTPFQSLALLHQADYDLSKAMCFLVPPAHKQWYPIDADKATALHTSTLGGPLMCRDQLEEWSAAEANLFDEALEKYGKDFNDIRQDFLPWKALRDIVEYYYMWKTTDRYVQQKRVKANEAESRLKQVYIPAYTKPNPNVLSVTNPFTTQSNKCCEGCAVESCDQWYSWGPPGLFLRLCKDCWSYWKKFGGLKRPHTYESFDKTAYQHSEQVTSTVPRPSDRLEAFDTNVRRCPVVGCSRQFPNPQLLNQHIRRDHFQCDDVDSSSSPATRNVVAGADGAPIMMGLGRNIQGPTALRPGAPRTRASFYIRTTPMTKVARRLAPKSLLNVKRSARNPFDPINMLAIKQHCQSQSTLSVRSVLKTLLKNVPASASSSAPPSVGPKPTASIAPKNVSRSGGANVPATFPQKRTHNGCSWDNEPAAKKFKGANELFMKWIRTPDDCYFHATKSSKSIRNILNNGQVRRAGRRPYRMQEFVASLLRGHSLTV